MTLSSDLHEIADRLIRLRPVDDLFHETAGAGCFFSIRNALTMELRKLANSAQEQPNQTIPRRLAWP